MPEVAGTGNTAPVLTTVTVLLFLWALSGYLVRVYVKIAKSDGWKQDDWAITGAIVAELAQLIATCYAVNQGYGTPWEVMAAESRVVVEKSLYASELLYIVSVGAARISASLFIAIVLARDSRNLLFSKILTGLCGVWTVAAVLIIALRDDLLQPWATLAGSESLYTRWLAIEVAGFTLDLTAAAVIVYFIYDLQMKTTKKLTVLAILNCRLLIAIPVAMRIHYLNPAFDRKAAITAATIRQVIIGCNIMFAALTCLKPFLKPFDAAAFGSGRGSSRPGLFGYINQPSKNATYYELSTPERPGGGSGNRKSVVMQSQRSATGTDSRVHGEDDEIPLTDHATAPRLQLRPEGQGMHVADIRHTQGPDEGYRRGNISMTQTWTVSRT